MRSYRFDKNLLTYAAGIVSGVVLAGHTALADEAALEVTCEGSAANEWSFSSTALSDRFLHIVWTGPQGQTRVSVLSYYSDNADDHPVFTGTFEDTVEVLLIDTSESGPEDGSSVEIYTEEWGWASGTCRALGVEAPSEENQLAASARQKLVGARDTTATNWLRRNGFTLRRTIDATRTGKIERWQLDTDYTVEIVYYLGRVSDVLLVET